MRLRTLPTCRTHQNCRLRSEEHTSELQSQSNLVCRLLLEKTTKHAVARLRDSQSAWRVLSTVLETDAVSVAAIHLVGLPGIFFNRKSESVDCVSRVSLKTV